MNVIFLTKLDVSGFFGKIFVSSGLVFWVTMFSLVGNSFTAHKNFVKMSCRTQISLNMIRLLETAFKTHSILLFSFCSLSFLNQNRERAVISLYESDRKKEKNVPLKILSCFYFAFSFIFHDYHQQWSTAFYSRPLQIFTFSAENFLRVSVTLNHR